VLQFGSGALLRGLTDYIVHQANQRGDYHGGVVVVGSTGSGRTQVFNQQGGLFTHRVEGVLEGVAVEKFVLNHSIQAAYAARDQWAQVLAYARSAEVQLILSNTTEVGLTYQPDDVAAAPPQSYPGKLTAFLHERFRHHPGRPLVILPTELIVDNGPVLRDLVLRQAAENGLEEDFRQWVREACIFGSTLVDRIVTGRPGKEKFEALCEQLGYRDELLTVSEVYYLWAIEGPEALKEKLGFAQHDEGVVITPDISPYRERKLRILNGSHTFMVGLAHLCGLRTVEDCMKDPEMEAFVSRLIYDEIVPSLPEGVGEGSAFGQAVLDRFRNPYLHHQVLDITLQYSSKMRLRNVPSIERLSERGQTPELMALGFAAYLHFLRPVREGEGKFYGEWQGQPYLIRDDQAQEWMLRWEGYRPAQAEAWVQEVLADEGLWGQDLSSQTAFAAGVQKYFCLIEAQNARKALGQALG
jgi:tagaturonate reductase